MKVSDFKIGLGDNFIGSITDQIKLAQMKQNGGTPNIKDIGADKARAEEAASEFESVLVQQMLKSMWDTLPKNGLLSGSSEEQLYQDMLQREVADHISKFQSFGIKDIVMEELKNRGEI